MRLGQIEHLARQRPVAEPFLIELLDQPLLVGAGRDQGRIVRPGLGNAIGARRDVGQGLVEIAAVGGNQHVARFAQAEAVDRGQQLAHLAGAGQPVVPDFLGIVVDGAQTGDREQAQDDDDGKNDGEAERDFDPDREIVKHVHG
jgi:hypothetical protein